ncbi:MAG: DUF5691 domain-containing protein [Aureispira sp.]
MNAWEALVRQALVGNNVRNKDAFALLEQLQGYGFVIKDELPPEKRLLQAAALQQHLHAAASQPLSVSGTLQVAAPTEAQAYCSSQRITQLRSILRYKHDEILIEWFTAIAQAKEVLLPELLPELLDYCSKRDFLQPYLPPILGTRGQWLAPLNPNWKYAQHLGATDQDAFFYGERAVRLQYLRQLAQQDATAALALVQQVWSEEGHDLRAAFLGVFVPLPPLDIALPFWEQAAQDKRKMVRQQALALLKRFPQASFVQRMKTCLQEWVQVTLVDSIEVVLLELPEHITPSLRKDGIVEQRSWVANGGPSANILVQVIAAVPPQWWSEHYDWSRSQWIEWAMANEWATVFMTGWARAAQRFEDMDWLVDCQTWFLNKSLQQEITTASFEFLYDNLSNQLFQELAAKAIALEGLRPFNDHHPLFTLLLIEGQDWREDFSKAVLRRIQLTIERESYVFHWTLKAVLKRAAYAIPASLHAFAQQGWPKESAAWPSWQKEVHQLISLLEFRKSIQEG